MDLRTLITDLTAAFVIDVRDISNSIAGAPNAKNATVQGNLNTTAKNLVGGINELKTSFDSIDLSAIIDDAVASATTTYSSNKITADINAAIVAALEGEDLSDLAAQVAANAAADNSLLGFGAPQTLTAAQKTQGQQNLGLGDIETADFVAAYQAARDAA